MSADSAGFGGRWRRFGRVALVVGWVGGLAWGTPARAVDSDATAQAAPFGSPVEDDRVYLHALIDELEGRFGGDDSSLRWEGGAWAGTDSNRLWFKTEGVVQDGRVVEGEHELLYDRPVSGFFDVQAGLRYDLDSRAGRGWAAVGVEGLAPQFIQVRVTAYVSDAGHFAARVSLSHEWLLTQRLILEPSLEVNAYTRPDPARDVASGVSDLEAGLRVRYEISRKLAPYFGVVYERSHGPADSVSVPGADVSRAAGWRLALGVRAWY